ncbi:MAG: thioredoxin domain-containing protein [Deltaproteobacteria bacterium]|nr:thioredoxin domain-containing protein [Deltaproteobacteria bacterium]
MGWGYTHDTSLIKWREYTPQAFEDAKKENKPVFILITASWCHWCHVYEENTLEDKEISNYLNTQYIPIFVDHDKRRDIVRKYPGIGIPLTITLTPGGEKLFSSFGYLSKDELLSTLMWTLKSVSKGEMPSPQSKGEKLKGITLPNKEGSKRYLSGFEKVILKDYDTVFGGFGQEEKKVFAEEMLRVAEIYERGRDKKLLEMLTNTLDHMAGLKQKLVERRHPSFEELSKLRVQERTLIDEVEQLQKRDRIVGIFDHVEGGFFRYATERDWSIPHYEKTLLENADLIRLFLKAYEITRVSKYKDVAVKSIEYVLNNLYDHKDGRFYGSQNADEVYYHWTSEERKRVKHPAIDKNSYTVSNAKMIIALLYASDSLKDARYKAIAKKALEFFKREMITQNGVLSYYDNVQKKGFLDGQLEDNAWMALAFLEAYKATKEKRLLEIAEGSIIRFAMERLYDSKGGGFFERRSTSKDFYRNGELFIDEKPPKENGVMAYALFRAYKLTGNADYLKKAEEAIGLFMDEHMTGEISTINPYFHRLAQALVETGRY